MSRPNRPLSAPALLTTFTLAAALCFAAPPTPAPSGMVWIPPGEFIMGTDSDQSFPNERPAHRVRLPGFWIDATEVTNAQFAEFIKATNYVTVAEKAPSLEEIMKQVPPGTPPPAKEMLVAGSVVFTPPDHAVPLNDISQWWTWTPGANWRHPEGPGSNIDDRMNHPVVHVSWDDAVAYAVWAGKRLPTEVEWECASRGGLEQKRFMWGDDPPTEKHPSCNIWEGEFPWKNTKADGYVRTAPVKSYSPNGYGLYDTAGNVWEWCSDWFRPDTNAQLARSGVSDNPLGPKRSFDPNDPYTPKRVMKGGSFLCNISYCESYRPSARRGTAPDTGMSHVGFRCVMTPQSPANDTRATTTAPAKAARK